MPPLFRRCGYTTPAVVSCSGQSQESQTQRQTSLVRAISWPPPCTRRTWCVHPARAEQSQTQTCQSTWPQTLNDPCREGGPLCARARVHAAAEVARVGEGRTRLYVEPRMSTIGKATSHTNTHVRIQIARSYTQSIHRSGERTPELDGCQWAKPASTLGWVGSPPSHLPSQTHWNIMASF